MKGVILEHCLNFNRKDFGLGFNVGLDIRHNQYWDLHSYTHLVANFRSTIHMASTVGH